ncbi:2-hydroxyacid dehydrogenase [Ornithinibacillus halophilus]|uniref:Glyoxylate reductase n=1 Tax=Ornithinibacillus halophilus TaxID=930117 RepID=A0A1M5JP69_9BACI|nr:D-glycerate dehydrogenase [Ornithinibacillus halophilus]SHG42367.1 glyoxylate reductase [Ornithinibacillus halophilus]
MKKKPQIFITRKLPEHILEPFRDKFEIKMWESEDKPVPNNILHNEVEKADGLLCLISERIDRALIDRATNLKIIANMAVGYDNIDVNYATEKGIIVTNTPDVLSETTADLTFSLLMATARRIIEASDYLRENKWENWSPYALAGTDIFGKTIGIVGMGRIGEAVARRAKGFGMKITYHNRNRKPEAEKSLGALYREFDELLTEADYVVSLVPLTGATKYLFDKNVFEKMKSSAIFINVSRGQVVDETALVNALQENQIKAAGLDVFEKEPIQNDHPLLNFDNVVCLPHIGSASVETRTRMLELCMENLDGFFNGSGPVTPIS